MYRFSDNDLALNIRTKKVLIVDLKGKLNICEPGLIDRMADISEDLHWNQHIDAIK